MSNVANPVPGEPRTVQHYIDELPMWPDGTRLRSAPMTGMQRLIWMLAAAGKFFEGFVVFMTGVALPLIARQFEITPAQHGFVTAATLGGILIGAVGFGQLVGSVRPEVDVHRGDDYLHRVPCRGRLLYELYLAGHLPLRTWARSRL